MPAGRAAKGSRDFHPLRIRVGKPIYPDLNEKPELAYERLTEELRGRVVEMWTELESGTKPKKPELTHA